MPVKKKKRPINSRAAKSTNKASTKMVKKIMSKKPGKMAGQGTGKKKAFAGTNASVNNANKAAKTASSVGTASKAGKSTATGRSTTLKNKMTPPKKYTKTKSPNTAKATKKTSKAGGYIPKEYGNGKAIRGKNRSSMPAKGRPMPKSKAQKLVVKRVKKK